MIIDKVAPFYTEQEKRTLAELDEQQKQNTEEGARLLVERMNARDAGDTELTEELTDKLMNLYVKRREELNTARYTIMATATTRYVEAFNGDTSAILRDARETISAIEKSDYQAYHEKMAVFYNSFLKNAQTSQSPKHAKGTYDYIKSQAKRGFESCFFYLMGIAHPQLYAFEYYGYENGENEIIDIAAEKAESFYKKPKKYTLQSKRTKPASQPPVMPGAEVRGDILTRPDSPALSLIYDVLSGDDLGQLTASKKKYNRHIQLLVEGQGDRRRVSYTKEKTTISIEIDDIRKITKRNPQCKKMLTRILIRANEQAIHNGEPTRDKVTFPLRELVGEGQYKNLETARQGFYKIGDTLTSLKISGKIERGKKKTIQQGVHAVLFKAVKVDNATCEVYLNELLNWGLITPYYTGIPDYYFELPDRAAELLDYIFSMARQNTRQIAEHGFFYISFRAIHYKLGLPSEEATKNPKRDIKDAIETAIEQIEEKHCKYAQPIPLDASGEEAEPDFSLLPIVDFDAPAKQYLDKGKLKVTLKGDYAKRFIDISQKTAAKVESARKRQERIVDQAKAMSIAKKAEKEKK